MISWSLAVAHRQVQARASPKAKALSVDLLGKVAETTRSSSAEEHNGFGTSQLLPHCSVLSSNFSANVCTAGEGQKAERRTGAPHNEAAEHCMVDVGGAAD